MKRVLIPILTATVLLFMSSFVLCKKEYDNKKNIFKPYEIEMIFVEGGTFTMDNSVRVGTAGNSPTQQITLNDFYIGKFEITQGQWIAVMGSNPSVFQKGDNYPVENVSWNDAQEFITKLNEITGKKFRLPTEEEWEYAARGGAKSKGYEYSGSNNIDAVAWFEDNSGKSTHPVGTKQSNELGIYDMTGNVREWCSDQLHLQVPAQGIKFAHVRIIRGSSWTNANNCGGYSESGFSPPEIRKNNVGFRLVHSVD